MYIYNICTFLRWPWTLGNAFIFQSLAKTKFTIVWVLIFKVYARNSKAGDCRMKGKTNERTGAVGC